MTKVPSGHLVLSHTVHDVQTLAASLRGTPATVPAWTSWHSRMRDFRPLPRRPRDPGAGVRCTICRNKPSVLEGAALLARGRRGRSSLGQRPG